MRKTQFFSSEIVVTTILFLVMIGFIFTTTRSRTDYMLGEKSIIESESQASTMVELLLTTPGYPHNWNSSYVEQIGIADSYYIINPYKMKNFVELSNNNYTFVKSFFNIKDYSFSLSYLNGTTIFSFNPNLDKSPAIIIRRRVRYEDSIVLFAMEVFE